MSNDFQYDVFLSHSGKDKAVGRTLAERLRQDGLKVRFDEWVIKSGDSYLKKRRSDAAEVFQIKNPRWADYWQQQI